MDGWRGGEEGGMKMPAKGQNKTIHLTSSLSGDVLSCLCASYFPSGPPFLYL